VINDDGFKLPEHYLECTKSQNNCSNEIDTVDIEELDFLRFKT